MEVLIACAVPAFYLVLPLGIVAASEFSGIVSRVGPLISCYIIGIVIGNSGILPETGPAVLDTIASTAAALTMPFMLFPLNPLRVRALPKAAFVSMLFAFLSITVAAAAGYFLFAASVPEAWKIAGLLAGVYTGGTPNLAAIQAALRLEMNSYLAVHTADVMLSGLYLFFLISSGKTLIRKILPAYRSGHAGEEKISPLSLRTLKEMTRPEKRRSVAETAAAGLLVTAAGFALSLFAGNDNAAPAAILAISTLSILVSFLKRARTWTQSFHIGEYAVLVFCTAAGSMADLRRVFSAVPQILLYVGFALLASILLHLILCRIFSIDADTMMITSTAAVFSPPFVGMVAVGIGNRDIIVPGITVGLIGYAVGNYLGISVAQALRLFG